MVDPFTRSSEYPAIPIQEQAERNTRLGDAVVNASFAFSVFFALYRGFRHPSAWSACYYDVSWQDGFYRRGLIGALLYPLGALRFNHLFLEVLQFLVLGALLLVFWRLGSTTQDRMVKALLLCSAAGGFLFNEVGYTDQVIWLFAAGAATLLARNQIAAASAALCLSILCHEETVLIAVPIVAASVLIRRGPDAKLLLRTLAAPCLCFCVVVTCFQHVSGTVLAHFYHLASMAGTPVAREDFFNIYRYGIIHQTTPYTFRQWATGILPAMAIAAWLLRSTEFDRQTKQLLWLCSVFPLLLVTWGWDTDRWIFLALAQSVVIWLIASTSGRTSTLRGQNDTLKFVAILALLLLCVHLKYFDRFKPRPATIAALAAFPHYVMNQVAVRPLR